MMIDKKRDDLPKKIVKCIFFISVFIVLLTGCIMLFVDKSNSLVILSIFLVALIILVVIFIFCIVEIILNNKINEKVKKFIGEKKYQEGIDYIKKIPKIRIMYDMHERSFYYCGLLNLYLDDQEEAQKEFLKINFNSSSIDSNVFINAILYLLLINNEFPENREKEFLEKCFNDNIDALKRNKYQVQKNDNYIKVIEKLLANDFSNVKSMLLDQKDIPLISRFLKS